MNCDAFGVALRCTSQYYFFNLVKNGWYLKDADQEIKVASEKKISKIILF